MFCYDEFINRTGKVNFSFPQYYKSNIIAKPPLQIYCIGIFHGSYIYTVSGTISVVMNYISPFSFFYITFLVLIVDKTLRYFRPLNFKIPK